ncbi:MAG: ribosome recycling factor [Microthrixaceae bacterium]
MSDELVQLICDEAAERMERAVAHTRADLASIRTGRANPALIEKLTVDYYGSMVPMQQLASFSVPDARMLVVTPFDKEAMPAIERSIQESNLGLNPSNDGVNIRLAFPQLTEERRRDFVRLARQKSEDGKNSLRGARREARKEVESLEKDGDISEDVSRRAVERIDKLAKAYEAQVDEAIEAKTADLMEV